MSLFGDFEHHRNKYLLEFISPIVGWCLVGTFANPWTLTCKKKQLGMLPSCACAVLDVILELQVLLEEAEKWYTPRTWGSNNVPKKHAPSMPTWFQILQNLSQIHRLGLECRAIPMNEDGQIFHFVCRSFGKRMADCGSAGRTWWHRDSARLGGTISASVWFDVLAPTMAKPGSLCPILNEKKNRCNNRSAISSLSG